MRMHGFFFEELLKFVRTHWNLNTEKKLLSMSGLSHRHYTSKRYYADEEMVMLLLNLSKLVKMSVSDILHEFGEFIVPSYFKRYEKYFSQHSTLFDFLKAFEETTHRYVRAHTQGNPPEIKFLGFEADNIAAISYFSERKLCDLAKGMLKGFASLYNEEIEVTERRCLLKGAPHCELVLTKIEEKIKE